MIIWDIFRNFVELYIKKKRLTNWNFERIAIMSCIRENLCALVVPDGTRDDPHGVADAV